jgi:hypothetical protein
MMKDKSTIKALRLCSSAGFARKNKRKKLNMNNKIIITHSKSLFGGAGGLL